MPIHFPHELSVPHEPMHASVEEIDALQFTIQSLFRTVGGGWRFDQYEVGTDNCSNTGVAYNIEQVGRKVSTLLHLGYAETDSPNFHLGHLFVDKRGSPRIAKLQSLIVAPEEVKAVALQVNIDAVPFSDIMQGRLYDSAEPSTVCSLDNWQQAMEDVAAVRQA